MFIVLLVCFAEACEYHTNDLELKASLLGIMGGVAIHGLVAAEHETH